MENLKGCDICPNCAVDTKHLLAYQQHITVECTLDQIEDFKRTCQQIGVKPIFMTNIAPGGDLLLDVFTSSSLSYVKPLTDFDPGLDVSFNYLTFQSSHLKLMGWQVLRAKIEIAPWMFDSKKYNYTKLAYWEAHFKFDLRPSQAWELKKLGLLPSWKMGSTDLYGTLRANDIDQVQFSELVASKVAEIELQHIKMLCHPTLEFVLFDTNPSLDDKWKGICTQAQPNTNTTSSL